MLARARSIRPIGQLWCFGLNIRYGINNHISETMANVLAEILMANVWNLKTNLKIWNESMREGEVRVLLNTHHACWCLTSIAWGKSQGNWAAIDPLKVEVKA